MMDYMQMAEDLAKTSRCGRHQVGCVMVKDGQVLVSGVNGIIVGAPDCASLGGCLREKNHIPSGSAPGFCYAVCAETRCVCEAARKGIALQGATVYCSHKPCLICMKNLAVIGVDKIYYKYGYPDQNSEDIAKYAGIEVVQVG
jgi:dCMP deaminase